MLIPLAPATGVIPRFRTALGELLAIHVCDRLFIEHELGEMKDHVLDTTKNRSVVGVMNQFASLAEYHWVSEEAVDLEALAVHLAGTPSGPPYKTHITPDRPLAAVAESGQDDLLRHRKRQHGRKT